MSNPGRFLHHSWNQISRADFSIVENITFTIKCPQMSQLELPSIQQLIRCFVQKGPHHAPILQVASNIDSFYLEILCNPTINKHCLCHIFKGLVLPLQNSILMWRSWGGEVVGDAIFSTEFIESCIIKLCPII